jgi:hypothetical protein
MKHQDASHKNQRDVFSETELFLEQAEDFLSPEQRMQAIAQVLASIALDTIRHNHEEQDSQFQNLEI